MVSKTKTNIKTKNKKSNITRRNNSNKKTTLVTCKHIYTPFEKKFSETYKMLENKNGPTQTHNYLKELLFQKTQSKILPENDFYDYVNYRWLTNKEPDSIILDKRQQYITQVDDFRMTQDKVYYQLSDIIKNYTSTNKTKLSSSLKSFYDAAINMSSITTSRHYINEYIRKLDEMRQDKNNIWKWLAYINKNEMFKHGSPFVFYIMPDDKKSKTYSCYIQPHVFPLVDINIYFNDGTDTEYKKKYQSKYKKYIKELFEECVPHEVTNVNDPFSVSIDLFNSMGGQSEKETDDNYNIIKTQESNHHYNFNWNEFSKELGFKNTPTSFITTSKNYLKDGTKLMLENWTSEKWRSYWIYIYIREIARLTRPWMLKFYEFYGGFERGMENVPPPEIIATLSCSLPFNTFLTNQYVNSYQNDSQIKFFKGMSEDLREVFIRIIKRNKWLSKKTKDYALFKLKKIKFLFGSPENLQQDPLLTYNSQDYIGNMFKILEWRHTRDVHLIENKSSIIDIPTVDFTQFPNKFVGTQSYIVNASYTPSKNGIYIPLGYIQHPFIDLNNRGIEYNLAHLGFTIAHEMSHALDDWGSKYDANGDMFNWWNDSDKKKFKEIQKDVVKQYEEFAKRDGIIFNATPGLGEDLADISGLAICEEYLRNFQKKNIDIAHIRNYSFKIFHVYFAYQMRQKVTNKALPSQLKTNPHPLDKYRTNIPLSRSLIFKSIHNVKKSDKMFWHSTDTSTIW